MNKCWWVSREVNRWSRVKRCKFLQNGFGVYLGSVTLMATFHLLCGLGRSFIPKHTLLSRVLTRPIHSTARTSKAAFASSWSSPAFFSPRLAPGRISNQSSVLKFIQNTPWKATHTQRRPPFRGQGRPPRGSWLDNLPQGTIFWGILVANVGVFAAWAYAENSIVRCNGYWERI